jgi:hypothetical protein
MRFTISPSAVVLLLCALPTLAQENDSLNVTKLAEVTGPWQNLLSITVVGEYAYIGAAYDGLRIFDISDSTAPVEIGFYDTNDQVTDVAVKDTLAFLAEGFGGLHVIDISDPTAPTEIGSYMGGSSFRSLTIRGDYGYAADYWNGLRIFDLSDPTLPDSIGALDTLEYPHNVALWGDYACVSYEAHGIQIVDISNPTSPAGIGFFETTNFTPCVETSGIYAYVANADSGVRVVDLSDPDTPAEAAHYLSTGNVLHLAISGNFAYLANMEHGLRVVDVSDPEAIAETGFYDLDNSSTLDVVVQRGLAFTVEGNRFAIYDCSAATPSVVRPPQAPVITTFALQPAYPNPFNPATTIAYDLSRTGFVRLAVYNLMGQKVATLVNGVVPAGQHTLSFDGSSLPSGTYITRLNAGDFQASQKIVLIK